MPILIVLVVLAVIVAIVLAKSGVSDGIAGLIIAGIVSLFSGTLAAGVVGATGIGIPFAIPVGIFVAYKVFKGMLR